MKQVQFIQDTLKDEFTKGRIYDTYTVYSGCHLAVKDDAGDEHLIASIRNEQKTFEGDSYLNENFVWGDAITPIPAEDPAKKLRIQHFPNVPCPGFIIPVTSLDEAKRVSDMLAAYDQFQYKNSIKSDYSNVTVLEEFDETEQEWVNWSDEETGIDNLHEYFDFLDECAEEQKIA